MQIIRSLHFYRLRNISTAFLSTNCKPYNVVLMCYYLLYSSCKLYWETNQLQETASDKNYEDEADCWDAKRNLSRGHKCVFLPLYNLPLNKYLACIKPFVWTNTGSTHSSCKKHSPVFQEFNRQTLFTTKRTLNICFDLFRLIKQMCCFYP